MDSVQKNSANELLLAVLTDIHTCVGRNILLNFELSSTPSTQMAYRALYQDYTHVPEKLYFLYKCKFRVHAHTHTNTPMKQPLLETTASTITVLPTAAIKQLKS
jgi:hypothetical protein